MKLRLNSNSLRLRLTRPELMGLCEAGTVERSVDFGLGTVLIYRIQSRGVTDPIHAVFCNHSISVCVPAESVAIWAAADEVGLYGATGSVEDSSRKGLPLLDPQAGRGGTRCLSPSSQ
jgi:hypothetical protein